MKKIFIYTFFLMPFLAFSQTKTKKELKREKEKETEARIKKLQKDADAGTIIFNKQSALRVNLISDGFSLGFEKATFKSIFKSNLFWFDIGERKSRREEKVTALFSNGSQAGNPYVFGKRNNFYFLQCGFGQQKLLGGKNVSNGVAVQAIYGGGLTLGMLKPYYLEVIDRKKPQRELIKYDNNDSRFLSPDSIFGSASFGKGFGEMKIVPGVFAHTAIRFDYGRFNDVVSALEVGINAEYYFGKMPIMIIPKEKNFFISGYVSLIFGGRR